MENRHPNNIIGGMFGFERLIGEKHKPPPFITDDSLLLVNARSCISVIIQNIKPESIWLPSYLCGDILQAIKDPSIIKFYEVDADLRIKSTDWIDSLTENDLVLVINYFGFNNGELTLRAIKDKKARLIEDACQSLLTGDLGSYSDFIIYSPRKFVGIPDGGILCMRSSSRIVVDKLSDPPEEWWRRALEASMLRRISDRCGGNEEWFDLFQDVEKDNPIGPYRMSDLSRTVLYTAIDYEAIATKRRDNYKYLLERIGEYAIFDELPENVVPLGFPIRLSNRNAVKNVLYKEQIYPPIHWDISNIVPLKYEQSHNLSSTILTLVCDQRYDFSDMKRVIDFIKKYAEK